MVHVKEELLKTLIQRLHEKTNVRIEGRTHTDRWKAFQAWLHTAVPKKQKDKSYEQIIDEYAEQHPKTEEPVIKRRPQTKDKSKKMSAEDLELYILTIKDITGDEIKGRTHTERLKNFHKWALEHIGKKPRGISYDDYLGHYLDEYEETHKVKYFDYNPTEEEYIYELNQLLDNVVPEAVEKHYILGPEEIERRMEERE